MNNVMRFWLKSSSYLTCILALSFALHSFSQASASQGEKIKTESELHLGITEAAFNRVAHALELGKPHAERTDLYFDIHEGGQFQLRRSIASAKLRIQLRADELVLQKSWIKNQQELSSSGFLWMATTRSSAKLKGNYTGNTSDRVRFTLPLIKSIAQANLMTENQKSLLASSWASVSWPKLEEFDLATEVLGEEFVPAAIVRKQRWVVELKGQGKTIIVQIGRDSDVLGDGKPTSFEIESELENASTETIEEITARISKWLESLGVEAPQTSPRSSADFFMRLENLYPESF
jgi:hypothetical protein